MALDYEVNKIPQGYVNPFCPKCHIKLKRSKLELMIKWHCPGCNRIFKTNKVEWHKRKKLPLLREIL